MTSRTLDEFRRAGVGYTVIVPDDTTTIITRPKTVTERHPPSRDWPEGRVVTKFGPETLTVETTADGFRVVRVRSPQDFYDLCNGNTGLQWERANTELRARLVAESRAAGPIR